ncbi:MAG: hypothetical protein EOP59_00275 [Sphingomonadales bacterium]|nr:MAG: hypothetical protein EOP59_00275 [Sphingomonadales bacterium]
MNYVCFNFRISSEHPLDVLAVARPEDDGLALISIRWGDVPETLADAPAPQHGLQVSGRDALLTIPEIARYLVRDGSEIVVMPAPGASARDVRLFLLGSALGVLSFQRGLLPLHANVLAIGGQAVAFAGKSGSGKSTLAAWFRTRGHHIFSDDICMIEFAESGPRVWPGLPRLKLWAEAMAAFAPGLPEPERVRDRIDKFEIPIEGAAHVGPLPLRSLYVLSRAEPDAPAEIERLRGSAAIAAVLSQTYRAIYLPLMGLQVWQFAKAAELLRHTHVYAAARLWGYDRFEAEAARLERHARGDVASGNREAE